ncbi:MAG TPA: hypothetical protein VMV19_06765 [Xanthobacteraceae bacterium]|nr:hypothetical protein [Xanthobacteraceae bacterium]
MRNELTFPVRTADTAPDRDAWAIVGFCLTGLIALLYIAATSLPLDDLSVLIVQYNLG